MSLLVCGPTQGPKLCDALECASTARAGDACGFAGLGWTCLPVSSRVDCGPSVVLLTTSSSAPPVFTPAPTNLLSPVDASLSFTSIAVSVAVVALIAILAIAVFVVIRRNPRKPAPPLPQLNEIPEIPAPSDPAHFLNQRPSMASLPPSNQTPAFYYKDDFDDLPLVHSIPIADISDFGKRDALRRHDEGYLPDFSSVNGGAGSSHSSREQLEEFHENIMKHQGKLGGEQRRMLEQYKREWSEFVAENPAM
ncbi:UNVERIFIED_CONTAM: hypothetical protein HDU68_006897 [Siphonaria sp. JEL0065]|nr:hypothetical protein HDU68_006897 [Siphonaria sp. JEL0065]